MSSYNSLITVILVLHAPIIVASSAPLVFSIVSEQMVIQKRDVSKVKLLSENQMNNVEITLTQKATEKLDKLTKKNINKRMQLSINNTIISSPIIQSELGSTFQIVMDSAESAKKLYDIFQ